MVKQGGDFRQQPHQTAISTLHPPTNSCALSHIRAIVMPTRDQFLESYDVPLEAENDFQIAGVDAQWASGHPKQWGQENSSFPMPGSSKEGQVKHYSSYNCAMSDDKKLLAISSDDKIWVIDVQSQEVRQELDGTGNLYFRPQVKMENEGEDGEDAGLGSAAYTLLGSVPDTHDRGYVSRKQLIIFELDRSGRLFDEEEPIDASALAARAIASIAPELEAKHEWSKEYIKASSLQKDFELVLNVVAADHRRRHHTTIDDAVVMSYTSSPFSSDGKRMLFNYRNNSTQHGMRVAEKLPQIVVYDVEANKELFRLQGHTDMIMWADFTPDDRHIGSVSWDGTLRMWNANDGSLEWISDAGGQCWAGAFSADSKHVVWSCNNGQKVKVQSVADGSILSTYPAKFGHWCRCLMWHPDGKQITLCAGQEAIVWRPFDPSSSDCGVVSQRFRLPYNKKWGGFVEVHKVHWFDNGNKLAVLFSDGSNLVWDSQTNAKEFFKRGQGTQVAYTDQSFFHLPGEVEDSDSYVTVDGDGMVRFWRFSVPAGPSWWEKEKEEVPKKEYPETGKYVKITKHIKPKEDEKERDGWAEKGAGLWTAE
ncbi:WD40-repeat-containing domain protein [Lophiotrema nucula]|uniref:WD40-repeat-containing domain protein n=1 Tax=Lophiotrema nucula TaxID=690887 RepID=A0A6A5ZDL2_9PLEO|nr:WD40-repeat-containing domain protein [Lophiotrema nucula]